MNKDSQIELNKKIHDILVSYDKGECYGIPELSTLLNTEIEKERDKIRKYIYDHDGGDGFSQADEFIEYIDSLPKSEKDSK